MAGRGSFSIMKVVCHPATRKAEEEATLDPTCVGGRVLVTGSRIVTPVVLGVSRVHRGSSSGLLGA